MLILQQAHLDVIGITLQTNSLANFNGLRVGVLSDVKATSYPFVMASSNVETLLVKLNSLHQIHYSTSKV